MKHDKAKKRMIFVLLTILVFTCVFFMVFYMMNKEEGDKVLTDTKKETLVLWYSDNALTPYLDSKTLAFSEDTNIRVKTKLVSGLEYLEEINKASISVTEDAPDMYIITNDCLEKAYLANLATELTTDSVAVDKSKFNQAAINAVTYKDKVIACPLYFETSALLYNKTYLEQIADESADNMENPEGMLEEEQLEPVTAEELIPDSIADILKFADKYSLPENVEYFFKWDVSDIFYNYFFIGNYISVGGEAGDDRENINIYNTESIASLMVYQELNQFFSIDTKETSYESIMQEFIEGKTIYTIATSDCIKRIDEAASNGEFNFEYGVAEVPNINSELITKGMSVTNALVVNGYSEHQEAANMFIEYIVNSAGADLYSMTGKISAVKQPQYDNEKIAVFMQNYENSVPMPKMIETSNFWMELEICFSKVWGGDDANDQLLNLSKKIKTQLAGEEITETMIENPDVELLPATEYE